jgi:hypothetical protein
MSPSALEWVGRFGAGDIAEKGITGICTVVFEIKKYSRTPPGLDDTACVEFHHPPRFCDIAGIFFCC